MADDKLYQFYARAARTSSIVLEVYREIKHGNEKPAVNAVKRLELELAGWQPEIESHDAYQLAKNEFEAARAVWQHVKVGSVPDPPLWPAILPPPSAAIESTIAAIRGFKFNVEQLRESIELSLPLEPDTVSMVTALEFLGQALDRMKKRLDDTPASKDVVPIQPHRQSRMDTTIHCVVCGKVLEGSDRDRSTCHDCRSPRGKVADLAIAIEASGDSPERIRDWPAIRHLLRQRYGESLGEGDLWSRCKDQFAAEGLGANEYLVWKLEELMDYLRALGRATCRSIRFRFTTSQGRSHPEPSHSTGRQWKQSRAPKLHFDQSLAAWDSTGLNRWSRMTRGV